MIIALAQLNYRIGDFDGNNEKIIGAIRHAKAEGADLVVFAELAIGGYPAKDLLRSAAFLSACQASIDLICGHCQDIACIIGAPLPNAHHPGKALINAGLFIADGEVKSITQKGLLPDYDIFDEYRYFQPAGAFSCVPFQGQKIALTICEDLWGTDVPQLYAFDPIDALAKENPDLIVNIAASPFAVNHFDRRRRVMKTQATKTNTPLFYVNQVGAHTDVIFDGLSYVMDADGELVDVLKGFEEDIRLYGFSDKGIVPKRTPETAFEDDRPVSLTHRALILGIRDYFSKSGFKKAVLGLSGGLDSAIVAALACEALGPENVLAVLMPSVYSSDHSIGDALDLVKNTGCAYRIVPIKDIAAAFGDTLADTFSGREPDLAEENIQARIRGTILMAISNKFGHILLNTSNKSEAAVGYGTLYGDMAGALSVIGDVYKSKAYELAKYINREREIIPVNTITKPPSAELRPDQKDSDSLPEYDLLDAILYQYIEEEKSGAAIVAQGYDEALVQRVVKLVNNAEFKRYQTPPTLRVSKKAFGPGRVMPLVGRYPF